MDTITHGIAGALIGKAVFGGDEMFALRPIDRARIATWSLMLGAIFPDSDVFRDLLSRNELLILTWHRSYTHSLVCLPIFAVLLAALSRWFARWRNWDAPSLATLTAIYAVGIFSHILLDLVTSFGTMIWSPVQWSRPAWDLIFIIDFTLTGILLAPQVLAWVYAKREGLQLRAVGSWMGFSLAAIGVYVIAQVVEASFSVRATLTAIVVLAIIFLLPGIRLWGLRVKHGAWNFGGLVVASGLHRACDLVSSGRTGSRAKVRGCRATGCASDRSSADATVALALGWLGSRGPRSLRNAHRPWRRIRHRASRSCRPGTSAGVSLLSGRAVECLYRGCQTASSGANGFVVRALSSHAFSQRGQRCDRRNLGPAVSASAARPPCIVHLSGSLRGRRKCPGARLGKG
jgi:membrane-bound metal-dependent hydrolase YbcI (DUF457 family)